MNEFHFGELRERTLHRQLKAHFLPPDGALEVSVGRWIADIWSPSEGILEIQTSSLSKLRPKLKDFLAETLVTVIHPVALRKSVVTWDAERKNILRERRSPAKGRIETLFREIGALAEFLLHPGFTLWFCLIEEREHRCEDGLGSWRRKGISKVDRELVSLVEVRKFHARRDWLELLPEGWRGPSTNKELAQLLGLRVIETQSLTSCYKKLGLLEDVGSSGRSRLLSLSGRTENPG
jgi:hypothetical protein